VDPPKPEEPVVNVIPTNATEDEVT